MTTCRPIWRATPFALLSVGVAAACTRFSSGDDGPLAMEGGAPDTGADTAPASTLDAAAGGKPTYCDKHPGATACADFESVPTPSGWTVDVTVGSTLKGGLDGTDKVLAASIDPTVTPPLAIARISTSVKASAQRVRVGARVRVTEPDIVTGAFTLMEIFCTNSETDYSGAWIELRPDRGLGVTVENVFHELGTMGTAWKRITLDVKWAPDDVSTVTATVDGATSKEFTLRDCRPYDNYRANVGLGTNAGQSARAFFDDVLYELDPKD